MPPRIWRPAEPFQNDQRPRILKKIPGAFSSPRFIRNLAKNWIANPSRFDPFARFGPRSGGTTTLPPHLSRCPSSIPLVKLMVLCVFSPMV